jgi:hypothetical protein
MIVTVMLVILADGSKLPPYVILNHKTMPKEQQPRGIIVRCQPKGQMTNELMKDWLSVVWNGRPGVLLSNWRMLVLDAFKGHLTPEAKATITGSSMNTDVVVIPGGMTSQLQVLDVVVNRPFKDHQKQLYSEWPLTGYNALTPAGRITKHSVTLLCQSIVTAWQHILPEMIVMGFKKCCISSIIDRLIISYGMTTKRMGMLAVNVRNVKALTVKME